MQRFFLCAFMLFVLSQSFGCGSSPESPPLDDANKAEIGQHDKSVDDAEKANK